MTPKTASAHLMLTEMYNKTRGQGIWWQSTGSTGLEGSRIVL